MQAGRPTDTPVRRLLSGTSRGMSTAGIVKRMGAAGVPQVRRTIAHDLLSLVRTGQVQRGGDGKWYWNRIQAATDIAAGGASGMPAASARLSTVAVPPADADSELLSAPGMGQLLDYYHAALRSDVRGRAALLPDRAGISWHLFTGAGEWWPTEAREGRVEIPLHELSDEFRTALERRASDDTIAVGWGISSGRDRGVDVLWPVALLAARWWRDAGHLVVAMERPDAVANPAWIIAEAGAIGWSARELGERLGGLANDAPARGLDLATFSEVLREAAAPRIRGQLRPAVLDAVIERETGMIAGAAALILPEEQSMYRGAVRDLERMREWDEETLAGTAVGPLLAPDMAKAINQLGPVLEAVALNEAQLAATRSGTKQRLTVVTGPPGTGKSQTVAALTSSAVLAGKRVLIASRNHQALDAVEERVGGARVVRTRDREGERDVSIRDVARDLVSHPDPGQATFDLDDGIRGIAELDRRRDVALARRAERRELELRLAGAIEDSELEPSVSGRFSLLKLLLHLLWRRSQDRNDDRIVSDLRRQIRAIGESEDPTALGEDIRLRVERLLPAAFDAARSIGDERRSEIGRELQDMELAGTRRLPEDVVETVLNARPVWLTTTLSAPARLPLAPGLFDLAIVDEASQADIASALPILARAKRVVVVGDDRQLGFIPSIGVAQERNLMRAAGITSTRGMGIFAQGTSTLFDLGKVQAVAAPEGRAVMLEEQYRSAPEITCYIGREFYDGRLRPAVDEGKLNVPPGSRAGLAWTDVPGREAHAPEGGWTNRAEVEAIVGHLRHILLEERWRGSVGVVTPFNAQAGAIKRALTEELPDEVRAEIALKVATIDSFQGDERALILFSPVAAGAIGGGAATFLARERRRLNVAISRAQAVAHVFGDLGFARTGRVPVLTRLAAIATEPKVRAGDREAGSLWERRLATALADRGLEPVPQYPIMGRRLDFALFAGSVKLDVEVDGRRWHTDADGNRKADDIFRDAMLRAAGWRVIRFWVSQLDEDMEACVERIERELR